MDYRVIESKITAPNVSERFIYRERLNQKLLKDKKVVCLHATVGYGKTVLLAQFVKKAQKKYKNSMTNFAWLHIDDEDNDMQVFLHCLREGIKQNYPDFDFEAFGYKENNKENISKEMLNDFILKISDVVSPNEGKLFIILDDFSKITSEKALNSIEYLIENTPDNISFLIATKGQIPSFLGKKMLDGSCEIVNQNLLKFKKSEVFDLINDDDLNKKKTCEYIYDKTEGWPSAVVFTLMNAEQNFIQIDEGNEFYDKDIMHNYLMHEIFKKLSLEIQEFLTKTALLDTLNANICNTILKKQNSDVVLTFLSQLNLATKVSPSGKEFRYHPIFKEFLIGTLSSQDKREIFEMASLYHFRKRNREECVDYAMRSNVFEMVQYMISKFGMATLSSGNLLLVKKWVDYLVKQDKELTAGNYSLCGKYFYKIGDMSNALKYFDKSLKMLIEDENEEEYVKNAILKAICVRNLTSLEESNIILDDIIARFRGKNVEGYFSAMQEKIFNLIFLSRYEEALGICTEAILTARRLEIKNTERAFADISVVVYFYMGKYHKVLDIHQSFTHLDDEEQSSFSSLPYVAMLHALYIDANEAKAMIDDGISNKLRLEDNQDLWIYFTFKAIIHVILSRKFDDYANLQEANLACEKARQCISFCSENHEFVRFIKSISMSISIGLKRTKNYEITNIEVGSMVNCHEFASSFSQGFITVIDFLDEIYVNEYTLKKLETNRGKTQNIFKVYGQVAKVLRLYSQNKLEEAVKLALPAKEYLDDNKLSADFLTDKQNEILMVLGLKQGENQENMNNNNIDRKIRVVSMGNFEVFASSENKAIKFRTKKAKQLFAWLFLMQGAPLDKDRIMLELWPENTEKSANNLLHSALYTIRKSLNEHGFSDVIQCKNKGYSMIMDEISSDIFAFDVMKKSICSGSDISEEVCLNVVSMHKGDFMQNIDNTFCLDSRRYYEKEYLKLLDIIAEKCINSKNYELATMILAKCCEVDRYNEKYYTGLMECYGKLGNTKMVKDIFENMKKIFSKELEVELCKEVNDVYKNSIKKISDLGSFANHGNSEGETVWTAI